MEVFVWFDIIVRRAILCRRLKCNPEKLLSSTSSPLSLALFCQLLYGPDVM